MTPKFSQYVDPIVEQVIDLLMAIEAHRSPSSESEWGSLNGKLRRAEKELMPTHGRAWELSKYALAAWIDEAMRNTGEWSGRSWWLNSSMEYELFKTAVANEQFFVNAKEAAQVPNGDDALETYYVCGMLGFRGFYGQGDDVDRDRVAKTAEFYGLPRSFAEWANETSRTIRERRQLAGTAASAEPRERRIRTAKPTWSRWALLSPCLFLSILAVAEVLVLFYVFGWWN